MADRNSIAETYAEVTRAALYGLAANLFLGIVKLAGGIIGNSFALIAGANIVIKEVLYHYNVRIGRRTGSAVIIASAWDHRSDALCSLAVLIGLATISFGGPQFIWADEVASLIVVTAIVWSGIRLFRSSASELMDLQADSEFVDQIRSVALSVKGIENVETLWVRKSGLEYFADIHIEVDHNLTVAEGHRTSG